MDSGGAIAEYDEDNNLLRKYIYGPGVDQPICMIDVEDSNSVYYYHFDGLGSVVALSDSGGDTVQTYEYSIFGQVAASDPNHPNPFMFTGRRLDTETGLYFYRARYYNPYIGRFMQTDSIGYNEGLNLYTYCGNNPLSYLDSSGLTKVKIAFYDGGDTGDTAPGICGGDDFEEYADDSYFEFSFDLREADGLGMSYTDYIFYRLSTPEDWPCYGDILDLSELEITDVYIFDHGSDHSVQIGDSSLIMGNPSGALENFLSRLGNSLDSYGMDAIIHFRGCNQGAEDENGNRTFLQQLAMYTNRRVTACAGAPASQLPHNPITGEAYDPSTWEGEGPDYRFTGSVFMSDPAGNVSVYWRLTVTSDWLGRPVLDYHDQPY